MQQLPTCGCGGSSHLVFSCSGAADTGELADRGARGIARDGAAQMACLAGLGGQVSGIMASARAAAAILVVDGCPLDCGRRALELAGCRCIAHLRLSDIGFPKGHSPVNDESVARVVAAGRQLINDFDKESGT
jgi:uncharacterized metal-binding protein